MELNWDGEGERRLLAAGLDPTQLAYLFAGPTAELADPRDPGRMIAVGQIHGRVLVCAYRDDGGTRRLLSARKATRHEHRLFLAALAGRD